MGYEFFNDQSKTIQICGILYPENFVENWRDIVYNCPWGIIISQYHTPDDKDKKIHVHFIIKDMHGHYLDFEKITEFICSFCKNPPRSICLRGGLQGLKDYARYMLHINRPDKEQFDLENPLFMDRDLPENGLINGKLNIFDDQKGFINAGGLDYIQCTRYTTRERKEIEQDLKNDERIYLLEYIYSHYINDFASFVEYAFRCGYTSVYSDSALYYRVITSIRDRQKMLEKGKEIVYADTVVARKSDMLYNKAMIYAYLVTFASTISSDVSSFIVDMCEDKIDNGGLSQLEFRRIFTKYIDPLTLEPRRYYQVDYDDYIKWRDAS